MQRLKQYEERFGNSKNLTREMHIANIEEMMYAVSGLPYRHELGEAMDRHKSRVSKFKDFWRHVSEPIEAVIEKAQKTSEALREIEQEIAEITQNGEKTPEQLSFNQTQRLGELNGNLGSAQRAAEEAQQAFSLRRGILLGGEHEKPFAELAGEMKAKLGKVTEGVAETAKSYLGLRIAGGAASALVAANGLANLYDKQESESPDQPEKKSLNFARVAQTAVGVTGIVASFALKNKLFSEQVSKITR